MPDFWQTLLSSSSMIRPTQGISFPRSGHAVLYHTFLLYFGDALVYCDPDRTDNTHCGCGSVPCINPRNTFSKNHDFGLMSGDGLPISGNRPYLIQYRSPVRSVASNFFLHLLAYPQDHNVIEWRKFACCQIRYWNKFVDKWVFDVFYSDVRLYHCSYERLVFHTETTIDEVLRFVSQGSVDEARMRAVMQAIHPRPLDRLRDFPYYDGAFFSDLEDMTEGRIGRLQLPSFKDGVG